MADKPSQLQSVIRFQEAYMEQEKMHKRKVRIVRSMLLVLFLALWELCARLGMIDDFIFSSPSRVLFCFWKMVRDGSIFAHIGITLFETVVSFAIVTASGICVAVLLWASRSASEILEPYLVMLNSLPKSALAHADRMDGKPCAYDYRGGGFRGGVWFDPDATHWIFVHGSG